MQRRMILRTAGGLLGTIGSAGCAGYQGGEQPEETSPAGEATSTPTAEPTPGGVGTTTVAMVTDGSEYYFDPIGLYVESGTTVTFEIERGAHSSTAYKQGNGPAAVTRIPENAAAWDSGILSEQGATFEHTVEVAGTYDYFCIPHKTLGMVGRLVVDDPGGPADGSMPPDGNVPTSQRIIDEGAVSYDDFSG